jgi:phenylalanyl-tRNA synthetase beta chain
MKFSEAWLREWVDPNMSTETLVHELTMAGLEVDGFEPVAPKFDQVVVGEVLNCEPHPEADKLTVCSVDAGTGAPLTIVCGAPNVRAGMKTPTALEGARLPEGLKIRRAKLRGVESRGMLCSEIELGLGDGADGIMELPSDAPTGEDLRDYLELDDTVIDVDLTPNRGDCFSILGIARETAVKSGKTLKWPELPAVEPEIDTTFPIDVEAPEACPRFCGRVIQGIDPAARTPGWMQEKLRRSGIRSISPVVDITNYVMMELGQPLHGFDLDTLQDGIIVRFANRGEKLVLLDGRQVNLDDDMLVIADHRGPRALAGIMGGEASGVSDGTANVFFEVAFFNPAYISGRPRRLGLHTDASLRFERGVDPAGQRRAIERATELLTSIAGGQPGPVVEAMSVEHLPERPGVKLRSARLAAVLGVEIDGDEVESILTSLGMKTSAENGGWLVTPPSWRFDIVVEEDLIEEVARVHGYDSIPETPARGDTSFSPVTETVVSQEVVDRALVDRGYREVVTYSFVDQRIQSLLFPDVTPIRLNNPISSEMSDMRVSLWPGMIGVLRQNLSRQQERVRIFESGLKFFLQDGEIRQVPCLAALMAGPRLAEQWSAKREDGDFFDLKGDLEAVLSLTGAAGQFRFIPDTHPALHPGQSARICRGDLDVGWIGALHPALASRFDISINPYLFEIETDIGLESLVPEYKEISRYPVVRRDLAVLVEERISSESLIKEVLEGGGKLLREVRIFDVYRGDRIDSGLKSIAFSLILQDSSRTLTDGDVEGVVQAVISRLERTLKARIRD